MGYQAVFKRYEIKYMVTAEQKARILKAMEPYMEMDKFGRSSVRNIYFDTDDFVLARHSIARPDFKEKLRVRSYSKACAGSIVFVELKRKYDGVVYKRRLGLPEADAMKWMAGSGDPAIVNGLAAESPQVASEIEYFKSMYSGLKPTLFLSYDREAYRMKNDASASDGGADFRVTFDSNILCREGDLTLRSEAYGTSMLEEGKYLMELKCPGAIPLWMTKVLSEERLYKTSYSKYGTAYCSFMYQSPSERAQKIAAAATGSSAVAKWSAAAKRNAAAKRGAAAKPGGRHKGKERSTAGQKHISKSPVPGMLTAGRQPHKRAAAFGRVSA